MSRRSALALAVSALVMLLVFPGIATGTAPSKDVIVTNDASSPVPTAAQGITEVAGTVDVGSMPPVHVASSQADPVFVKAAAPTAPFQQRVSAIATGGPEECDDPLQVPRGLTLTVESFNFEAAVPAGDTPNVYLRVVRSRPGLSTDDRLGAGDLLLVRSFAGVDDWRGTVNLSISTYDAGADISIRACIGNHASGSFEGYVTGHVS